MIRDLIPFIKSGETVPHDLMRRTLNFCTDTLFAEDRRAAAREFSSEAADYLPGDALIPFIAMEFEESEYKQIIAERLTFIARLQDLCPAILSLFGQISEDAIRSAIHQVHDCCHDYHYVEASPYASVQRKTIIQNLRNLVSQLEAIDLAIKRTSSHVGHEYDRHINCIERAFGEPHHHLRSLEMLREELKLLRFSARLTLYKDEIGQDAFYVGDNRARTQIVEWAYRLSLQFGTPEFVTTPGSNFSGLCSLLFELATGIQDESLAGAINRFARSDAKREITADEIQFRHENSDEGIREYESDNFSAAKASALASSNEMAFWQDTLRSPNWNSFEQTQIRGRYLAARDQFERAVKTNGPHLIWASQMSPSTHKEANERMRKSEADLLASAIELGRAMRERQSTGFRIK